MTRQWAPGDVVSALLDGNEIVGLVRGGGQYVYYADSVTTDHVAMKHLRNVRLLVVIDPEDREQVRRLLTAILDANDPLSPTGVGLAAALREFADPKPPKPEARPIVHAVMYRDYKIGSLCDSGAWGAATLFSMVTDDVTCPGCRSKLDGGGVS